MNRKPVLYIMCGCPASGKSTWARKFLQIKNDVHYVSRDEIRFSIVKEDEDYFSHEDEVFRKFVDAIAQTLIDGFDVLADATHLNVKSRRKLTDAIDKYFTDYTICYVYMDASLNVCLENNANRQGRAYVPEAILKDMYKHIKCPSLEEDNRAHCIFHYVVMKEGDK